MVNAAVTMDITEELSKLISNSCSPLGYKILYGEVLNSIEEPKPEFGDLSSTISFTISKQIGANPNEIAKNIKKEIEREGKGLPKNIESCNVTGGYLNFKFSQEFFRKVIEKVLSEKERFGSSDFGKGKTAIVEYSQPNIGKPFHVGHIRSTILGDAVKKILSFVGYKTIGFNYLGDAGTQVAKLILGMKILKELPEIKDEKDMLNYYVEIHKKIDEKPELKEEAREILEKIEFGDPEVLKDVKKIQELSMIGFKRNYNLLDIEFDEITGESLFIESAKKIVDEALKKGITFKGKEGEIVTDLEKYNLPNTILLRSNGTTLYLTRDLALAEYKYNKYNFDISLILTDMRQNLHFQQVFKILELLGKPFVKNYLHQGFGLISLKEGVIATRVGRIVFLEDVLNRAIKAAEDEISAGRKKEYNKKETEEIAKIVGIGAAKFSILRVTPEKDVVFDFKKMVSFEGDTGVYIQYSCVRAKKILEKLKLHENEFEIPENCELNETERELVKIICKFPSVIAKSAESFRTNIVADYALDVADSFNKFYEKCPVIQASETEKKSRAAIVYSTKFVLENSLSLLGIKVPEKM